MGKCQRRRKNTSKNKQYQKVRKTKHRTRDIDEILVDLMPENLLKNEKREIDEDLPGLGQFYCVFCSRYFTDNSTLQSHIKTKEHKKRVKRTKDEPYTIEDSKKYGGQMG
jgi:bud site selection protein 20